MKVPCIYILTLLVETLIRSVNVTKEPDTSFLIRLSVLVYLREFGQEVKSYSKIYSLLHCRVTLPTPPS